MDLFRPELIKIISPRHEAEELLKETINAGLKTKAVKPSQLKRVNVDTTVQEKQVRFPTDARLYDRAWQRLVAAAEQRGIALRQNYNRNAKKKLILKQSRYAHALQMKRAGRCTSKLKTYVGRVIMDRNRLKGTQGDMVNAILSAVGMNFRKLLRWAALFLGFILSKIIQVIWQKYRLCGAPI